MSNKCQETEGTRSQSLVLSDNLAEMSAWLLSWTCHHPPTYHCKGEQDSARSQEPEVAERIESFVSQLLVNLTELLQFLVETEAALAPMLAVTRQEVRNVFASFSCLSDPGGMTR